MIAIIGITLGLWVCLQSRDIAVFLVGAGVVLAALAIG